MTFRRAGDEEYAGSRVRSALVTARNNMDDLRKELASLRLDDEPPRSRRGAWVVIALLVFMVGAGTIFWWGHDQYKEDLQDMQGLLTRIGAFGGCAARTARTST